MKKWFSCFLSLLALGCSVTAQSQRPTPAVAPRPTPNTPDSLAGTDYRVTIGTNGMVNSFQVGGEEWLAGEFLYGNRFWHELKPTAWIVLKKERVSADTLKYTLASPEFQNGKTPVVEMAYTAKPDQFLLSLKRLSTDWGGCFGWNNAPNVTRVTALNVTPAGYKRLPGRGVTYGLPYPGKREAVRDLIYSLDETDYCRLQFTYKLGDGSYNRQSEGTLYRNGWGRELIETGKALEFSFRPLVSTAAKRPAVKGGNPVAKPAPAFALRCEKRGQMFRPGEEIPIRLVRNGELGEEQKVEYRFLSMGEKNNTFAASLPLVSTRTSDDHFKIPAPLRTGWYRLRVQLTPAIGTENPTQSTQDEIEIGVYHPSKNVLEPNVTTDSDPEITGMLGLKCQRLALYFSEFFPSREKSPVGDPNYNWKPLDERIPPFVEECKRVGVQGFVLLNVRPQWCDEKNFTALMREIVGRYGGLQKVWEIENEPNGSYPSPESYVKQALKPAYTGAHAARPDVVILGPGIVRVDLNWLGKFFKAGGADFLDAVSTHTYTGHNRSWEEHGNLEQLRGLRTLMTQYGAKNKPIWITETGFTWDNHSDMPRLHGEYCVRIFALAASVGIPTEHFYYFYTKYAGFQPWYLYDHAPNYSGMAMRIYGEQTAGKRFAREIALGRHAHGVVFADPNSKKVGQEETAVLWTDDFTANATLKLSATAVKLCDLMGNPIPTKVTKKGTVILTLSGSPVYLTVPKGTTLEALTKFGAGTDLALAANGATPEASSAEKPELIANLNDGTWHFDDGQSDQKIWIAKKGDSMPQWATITFSQPRTIGSIFITSPSSNGGLPGVRDFEIQVMTDAGWKTVREGKGNVIEWTLFARFKPLKTQAIRLLISDLNNGWWRDDKTPYTDFQARVYEMEAYPN